MKRLTGVWRPPRLDVVWFLWPVYLFKNGETWWEGRHFPAFGHWSIFVVPRKLPQCSCFIFTGWKTVAHRHVSTSVFLFTKGIAAFFGLHRFTKCMKHFQHYGNDCRIWILELFELLYSHSDNIRGTTEACGKWRGTEKRSRVSFWTIEAPKLFTSSPHPELSRRNHSFTGIHFLLPRLTGITLTSKQTIDQPFLHVRMEGIETLIRNVAVQG